MSKPVILDCRVDNEDGICAHIGCWRPPTPEDGNLHQLATAIRATASRKATELTWPAAEGIARTFVEIWLGVSDE